MSDSKQAPWQLVEQGGAQQSASLPAKGTLIIGSSADRAGLQLTGQGVEPAHCAIGCLKGGGWAIKDLGSRFGTFVNGSKVQSQGLSLGDVIVLGSVRLELLEAGAKPKPAQAVAPLAAAAPKQATRQLGGYRIEGTLGRGGMGEVVLGLQESLNRHVAIKLLSTKLASDREFVQAFHSEARSAAALNHPNVVVVHDVGEVDGQHYLSMEYMPGGSLEDRVVKEGRLPWREVLNILHDAAAGLAYAESQGIVHRDIKPANLMLASSGAVKIADLGLALNVNEQGAGDSAEGRKTFGTPHFISPEQARGQAVDPRSDLYSLGASAYRLLSGRTPFQGETTREIVRARFISDPPPLANSVPGMPDGLHQLVHKLMQRDPDKRYASARELLSEVDLLRLRADHGTKDAPTDQAPASQGSKLPLMIGAGMLLAVMAFYAMKAGGELDPSGDKTTTPGISAGAQPGADRGNNQGATDSDSFFGNGQKENLGPDDQDSVELALLRLEVDAIAELRRIPGDLSVKERILELEAFAQRFAGTDTAVQALSDVAKLRLENLDAEQLAETQASLLGQSLAAIKTHIGWPQPLTNPANLDVLLKRLAAYLPPPELAENPKYQAGLLALRLEIIAELESAAADQIATGEEQAAQGNFEPLRTALEAARLSLWPGEMLPGESQVLVDLRSSCAGFKQRLNGLEASEAQFAANQVSADRASLALCFGPSSNLRAELLDLDLAAALARMQTTLATLQTEDARSKLGQVSATLQAAQRSLALLGSTHKAGLWKRRSISVPKTSTRSSSREATSVMDDGIVVADDGSSKLVAWAEFAHSDAALAQLFKSRLTRPWSAAEAADIASLLSLPALAKALDQAGARLLSESQGSLSPRVIAAMASSFDGAVQWIEEQTGQSIQGVSEAGLGTESLTAPERAQLRVLREREAVGLLAQALVANQNGSLALCIALIETLLDDYSQTLLVLMLSSGAA